MKNRLKIALTALSTAMAVLIASFVVATPAYAAWDGCPDNKFCTYWDSNGNGAVYYYSVAPSCITIGAPWSSNISSVWNRTPLPKRGYNVRIYKDSTCSADVIGVIVINAQTKWGNLGWPYNFNDQVRSLWFVSN